MAAAAAKAGGNLAERGLVSACVCACSLGAQRGQDEPNELQKSICCEVRESNIPLELCVYTARREGGWQRGSMRGLQEGKQINSQPHCILSTCRLPPRYSWTGPHPLLNHYRHSSARPAKTACTVYHNLVFRNPILHVKHWSRGDIHGSLIIFVWEIRRVVCERERSLNLMFF